MDPVDATTRLGVRGGELEQRLLKLRARSETVDSEALAPVALLIVDSVLEHDENALSVAQRGLQRLYGRLSPATEAAEVQAELRGRVLGLIDVVHWASQRIPPDLAGSRFGHAGNATQVLRAFAKTSCFSDGELAVALGLSTEVVSEIVSELAEAGLVSKHWTVWVPETRPDR